VTAELVWVLIRQDNEDGNCYRVGRFGTRDEAERLADVLGQAHGKTYVIERVVPGPRIA